MQHPESSSSTQTSSTGQPWPVVAWAALFLLTVVLMVRGGLSADLRGIPANFIEQAHQQIAGRYIGMVDITLRSLPSLTVMMLGALGLGALVRKFTQDKASWLTSFTAGLGLLWLAMYVLALTIGAQGWIAWGLCIAGIAAGGAVHHQTLRQYLTQKQSIDLGRITHLHWACILTAAPLALLVVAACCPPGSLWAVEAWGYDVKSYHLQIPREWMQAGRMVELEHNVYSQLPSLVEVAFLQLGLMRNGVYEATYACQLLSVLLAVIAAANLARFVRHLLPGHWASFGGWVTAALFLATPWVLVTGSMAYNEMAILAFGAGAVTLTLQTPLTHATVRLAVLAGVLAGLATLAKLTGGFMIAIPVGLLWIGKAMPASQGSIRKAVMLAAVVALAGAATLGPYLIRNTLWTGNPVFPFAAKTLGKGHWDEALVDRWNRGHHVDESFAERLKALGQHWAFNTGYGALGGRERMTDPSHVEARNVAYFPRQWGFPTLILLGLVSIVGLVVLPPTRRLGIALAVVLLLQIVAWLTVTHLQSRFMIFSLLPLCLGLGVMLTLASQRWLGRWPVVPWGVAVGVTGVLTLTGAGLMQQQAVGQIPLWQVIDSLPALEQAMDPRRSLDTLGDHPLNKLPAGSRVLIVADNSSLFYIHQPMVYHSAFDASPLGQWMRQHPGDPAAVTRAMKQAGITHVWIHLGELNRLMSTYGFDPEVTPESLHTLMTQGQWRRLPMEGSTVLLMELP